MAIQYPRPPQRKDVRLSILVDEPTMLAVVGILDNEFGGNLSAYIRSAIRRDLLERGINIEQPPVLADRNTAA